MKKLTSGERRFLIIWFCINFFALFVNIASIKGHIKDKVEPKSGYNFPSTFDTSTKEFVNDYDHPVHYENKRELEINLFTAGHGINEDNISLHPSTFYPFTSKFMAMESPFIQNGNHEYFGSPTIVGYNGIFNGYGYLEFLVYSIVGLAIVYIPKIWK